MNDMNMNNGAEGSPLVLLFSLALIVFVVVAIWKVFTKAGQPGWGAIIPIYNIYLLCRIAGKPGWWVLLMLIPIVNIIVALLVALGVAAGFGKGAGFGIGLFFLPFVFYPILAFGPFAYGSPRLET